jgi:inactivated superfamily I helicase
MFNRIHLGITRQSWWRASLLMLVVALSTAPAFAAEKQGGTEAFQSLDKKIQNVKQEVLDLNRDLFVLEEELLFPASTQVAVFLSVDVGEFFQLDSVQLKLDDKMVTNYLYTERENAALLRGGVQRLYMGNLRTGKHELVAVFTGKGTHERDYKRGTTLVFEKQTEPKYIELKIRDLQRKLQPEFEVKESK